jgi:predicted amidohydrolase YtcJ
LLEQARAAGEQALFHAVGDATIEAVLDALERQGGAATWRPQRVRLEHGDLLAPDLVERARQLGVVVVQNPLHFTNTDINAERWGAERLAHGMPLASLLHAGIPIALGSDINGVLSPYVDLAYAVTHPTNPAEALSVEETLAAHTSGAAFAEFAEHDKGRLLPGMLADLAVLSQDIFTVPTGRLAQTVSLLTIVGGEIAYCDAALTGICP